VSTGPGRILVIDDERIALKNLLHVLGKEGYAVVGAQSGPAGLKALSTQPFDLVITDLRMEQVDGLACATAANTARTAR